ncbi:formate dehydrogenase accessory protein FdhE domain-containing protein [Carboxydothermus pertinax]|uniref:Formate dehydrogenase subunit epsilon n=1 Tax=Carboxydothermus pertinax TaxID=870242 RepID=A0A1L8CUM4_9THEO|nr:formate dehydrogenase accessory protein FdhE [Carboxydothermus pertinax]GAV22618.1 formate dehydrogenase subunit epsilon [Carboxydothermus pertinax]
MEAKKLVSALEKLIAEFADKLLLNISWNGKLPVVENVEGEFFEEKIIEFLTKVNLKLISLEVTSRKINFPKLITNFKERGSFAKLLKNDLEDGFWEELAFKQKVKKEILALHFLILRRKMLRELNNLSLIDKSNHQSCPICGTAPGFAAITPAGERILFCLECHHEWHYYRLGCPKCGNKFHEDFLEIHLDGKEETPYFGEVCKKCGSYLKTKKLKKDEEKINPNLEDVESLFLDYLIPKKINY